MSKKFSSSVCVVTVNYFSAEETRKCVLSLTRSTVPVYTVVVDNSPDDPELAASLAEFSNVKILNAPENLGFGRGNNLGFEWVYDNIGCEFVFILNNDAQVKPDTIEHLIMAMEAHDDAAMIASRIVLTEDESKLWYGGGEVDWRRGGGVAPGVLGAADAKIALMARYVTFCSGCAMFVRRHVLEEMGGFDKRFFMYEEDLELSLRIQQAGWKIWYDPAALVMHLGQGSLRTKSEKFSGLLHPEKQNLPFYTFHIITNRLLNMSMYAHGRNRLIFVLFFPLFVLKLFATYFLRARFDGCKAIFQAFIAFRKLKRDKSSLVEYDKSL